MKLFRSVSLNETSYLPLKNKHVYLYTPEPCEISSRNCTERLILACDLHQKGKI